MPNILQQRAEIDPVIYDANGVWEEGDYAERIDGVLKKRKRLKSVAKNGEYVRTDWTMFDHQSPSTSSPSYQCDGHDPFAPISPPSFINLNTPQGQAWAERGREQRDAWKSPPTPLAASHGEPGGELFSTGTQHPVAQHTVGSIGGSLGSDGSADPRTASYGRPTADAARAAGDREAAWEQRGEIQRNAWRYP